MIRMLALELSASPGSLALLADGRVELEKMLMGPATDRELFEQLPAAFCEANWDLGELDVVVPGRGPGSYTGLRIAMTVARTLALTERPKIWPVTSADALALELLSTRPISRLVVVGDARRGGLWWASYEMTRAGLARRQPITLSTPEALRREAPTGAVFASPEYSRLQTLPECPALFEAEWIMEDCAPHAAWLGRIAFQRLQAGETPEPATPLYLHPAV